MEFIGVRKERLLILISLEELSLRGFHVLYAQLIHLLCSLLISNLRCVSERLGERTACQ
jgi:hypothetical protein